MPIIIEILIKFQKCALFYSEWKWNSFAHARGVIAISANRIINSLPLLRSLDILNVNPLGQFTRPRKGFCEERSVQIKSTNPSNPANGLPDIENALPDSLTSFHFLISNPSKLRIKLSSIWLLLAEIVASFYILVYL